MKPLTLDDVEYFATETKRLKITCSDDGWRISGTPHTALSMDREVPRPPKLKTGFHALLADAAAEFRALIEKHGDAVAKEAKG